MITANKVEHQKIGHRAIHTVMRNNYPPQKTQLHHKKIIK